MVEQVDPSFDLADKMAQPTRVNLTVEDEFLRAEEKYKKGNYQEAIAETRLRFSNRRVVNGVRTKIKEKGNWHVIYSRNA